MEEVVGRIVAICQRLKGGPCREEKTKRRAKRLIVEADNAKDTARIKATPLGSYSIHSIL